MSYENFLGTLINILFFLVAAGIISAVISTVFIFFRRAKNSTVPVSFADEEKIPAVPKRDSQLDLTREELEQLMHELQKEKRAAAFGFSNMTPTHQEATKMRIRKIDERLTDIRSLLANGLWA